MDRCFHLLSFYSAPLSSDSSARPRISPLLNQSREPELGPPLMRHVMQVNRSDFQLPTSLIQTSISLSPYIFHFRWFFFPIIPPSVMPPPVFHWIPQRAVRSGLKDLYFVYEYKQDLRRKKKNTGGKEATRKYKMLRKLWWAVGLQTT